MTALATADDARALLPFEIRYDDEALYVESPDVPVSIVIHGDDEADARSIAERIAAMMNAAPATPAPADGAPGDRESVDSFELDALRGLVRAERTWDDYAWRLAARGVLSSAAPLPAPSASAGVGADEQIALLRQSLRDSEAKCSRLAGELVAAKKQIVRNERAAVAAAWDAAGAAAGAAAGDAAGDAVKAKLAPTVAELQQSARDLVIRMCEVGRESAAE